jgi:hypothetical protein
VTEVTVRNESVLCMLHISCIYMHIYAYLLLHIYCILYRHCHWIIIYLTSRPGDDYHQMLNRCSTIHQGDFKGAGGPVAGHGHSGVVVPTLPTCQVEGCLLCALIWRDHESLARDHDDGGHLGCHS